MEMKMWVVRCIKGKLWLKKEGSCSSHIDNKLVPLSEKGGFLPYMY